MTSALSYMNLPTAAERTREGKRQAAWDALGQAQYDTRYWRPAMRNAHIEGVERWAVKQGLTEDEVRNFNAKDRPWLRSKN